MKQLIIGACLAGAATLALAQSWPTAKPIRIIVAYPAGGVSDNIARALADKLAMQLGTPVVVENKAGDIFDPAYLEVLRKINDDLYLIPGVDRSWMKSVWMPIVRWREVTEDGINGGAVMPSGFDGSDEEIEKLRDRSHS